jgi:GT2 family glycosyltransferase
MPDATPAAGPVSTLAVVVPASDRPPSLPRCLAALRASNRVPDELVIQTEPAGAGPAAVRNAGARGLEADVLVFVDSDVEVHADALARIERHLATDPALAAVFGAYDDTPAAPGLTSRFRNLLHHHVHASSAGRAETFWAGLGAVRREVFEAVGGFDAERFPLASVEDIELGMRLQEVGATILLDPAIRGTHLKAWTPLSMVRTDLLRRGVPWTRLLLRNGRGAGSLNLGWRHRVSAVATATFAAALAGRRLRAALAALLAVLALNRSLYRLLLRRGGPRLLLAGIGLHLVHQLTAALSLPLAVVLHLRDLRTTANPAGGWGDLPRAYDG